MNSWKSVLSFITVKGNKMKQYEVTTKDNAHMFIHDVAQLTSFINVFKSEFICVNLKTGCIFKFDVGGKYNYVGRVRAKHNH